MDLKKITDTAEQAIDFVNTCLEIQNNYITQINDLLEELETTINDASIHSSQYVNTKIEEISGKMDKVLSGFEKKIEKTLKGIEAWYDKQLVMLKKDIIRNVQAKLGINLPDSAIESLAEAIPHPDIPIPEFKIKLPKYEINPDVKVSIPRIPTVNVPGMDKAQNAVNKAKDIAGK